jgi:hypothetical protein
MAKPLFIGDDIYTLHDIHDEHRIRELLDRVYTSWIVLTAQRDHKRRITELLLVPRGAEIEIRDSLVRAVTGAPSSKNTFLIAATNSEDANNTAIRIATQIDPRDLESRYSGGSLFWDIPPRPRPRLH